MERILGEVIYYDEARGFGWLRCPDGPDVFFHTSRLAESGIYAPPGKQDRLSFVVGEGRKGKNEARDLLLVERVAGGAP
jgi:cold shock CspA family protein